MGDKQTNGAHFCRALLATRPSGWGKKKINNNNNISLACEEKHLPITRNVGSLSYDGLSKLNAVWQEAEGEGTSVDSVNSELLLRTGEYTGDAEESFNCKNQRP